jgi:hypothetical protein
MKSVQAVFPAKLAKGDICDRHMALGSHVRGGNIRKPIPAI